MNKKIITFSFLFIIYLFFILNILLPKDNISYDERRYLEDFPKISLRKVSNGKFFKELDYYLVDNFSFRNIFRRINVFYNLNILNKKDYKNYYVEDYYVYKIEKLNYDKVISFTDKMNKLNDRYFDNSKVFLSIIPDKSYYMKNNYSIDFDYLEEIVLDNINNINYIDISDDLNLSSYYYSDIHWKGDSLYDVSLKISDSLNVDLFDSFNKKTFNEFRGSYYGNVVGVSKLDKLVYLDNDVISNCSVSDTTNNNSGIYQEELLNGFDSYDVYLGGNKSIVKIDNPSGLEDRELIIFGDSFSRSLVPLLLKSYKKIIIIDLRYIDSSIIGNYVDFNNKEILLLYSSSIINSSDIIKVK